MNIKHGINWVAVLLLIGFGSAVCGGIVWAESVRVEDGHTGAVVDVPVEEFEENTDAGALDAQDAGAQQSELEEEIVEVGEEEAVIEAEDTTIIPTAEPTEWVTPATRRCRRYRRRRYCDGPLRVPVPRGEGIARAQRLALGHVRVAHRLISRGPDEAWSQALADEHGMTTEPRTLRWPVDGGRIWRGMRRRRGRKPAHKGVDIGARSGTHILAVNDAIVAYVGNELRGYGNVVLLVHADTTVTLYAHMRAVYVFAGMRVQRAQVLGEVGRTGLAKGAHLHFEYRVQGRPTNPQPLFVQVPERHTAANTHAP